jgi:RNA polymerase sigma-70 factor (ECF subfamily)
MENEHDAEDVTQVTFVKAFRNLNRFNPRNSFVGWLFTIARRSALNHVRSARPSQELNEDLAHDGRDPATSLQEREATAFVWRLARRLKPNQHQALWLRFGEGFSIEETARVMRITSLHVRVLLHRGRVRLAQLLEDHEYTVPGRTPAPGVCRNPC